MPIYEYSCCDCHTNFEELVLSPRETISCPQCESSQVEKKLSVFSSPGSRSEKTGGGGCGCTPSTCGCH